jgi:hypothetical protein
MVLPRGDGAGPGEMLAVRLPRTRRSGFYGRNTVAPPLFHIFDLLPPESILPIAAQPKRRRACTPRWCRPETFRCEHCCKSRAAAAHNLSSKRRTSRACTGWVIFRATRSPGHGRCAALTSGRQRPALGACADWSANYLDAGRSRFCQDLGHGSSSQVHHRRSVGRIER